ncbi:MAG TPA: hypothetical protein VKH45_00665 [Candidatus Acidoferrum sp.]|nr:hypothetical protein [Candidatus Acidoferrum sp.]
MVCQTKRALVLACGNPLQGDDAVALEVAKSLVCGFCDGETEVYCQHQWLPEMAEAISGANLVVFLEASHEIASGAVCTRLLVPAASSREAPDRARSPEKLLALAHELYHSLPEEAYLVSIGGDSFECSNQLSERVRRAIPLALNQVKAILSGVSLPQAMFVSGQALVRYSSTATLS